MGGGEEEENEEDEEEDEVKEEEEEEEEEEVWDSENIVTQRRPLNLFTLLLWPVESADTHRHIHTIAQSLNSC